jgi:tRNA 2-thiouridine synthesizing protein A
MPTDSPSSFQPLKIDARGHKCPVPTLKLRRALQTSPCPQIIEILADDPMAQIDIPHFCLRNKLPEPEVCGMAPDDTPSPSPAYWRFVICTNAHG